MRFILAVGIMNILLILSMGCVPTANVVTPSGNMGKGSYMDITPVEAKTLIEKTPGITIIDVSGAYAQGHLPGAVSYPLGGTLNRAVDSLDKDKVYLVYCHGEAASMAGAQKLVDSGFMKVYRLKGDYDAWVQAGYPVEK